MDLSKLSAPFDPAKIHWRLDSIIERDGKLRGRALCYLDARDVMDRLDEACGPDGWQSRVEIHGSRVLCSLGVRCGDEWLWKTDGAGDTAVEAEKGAISDALKRAAVSWGVGRYLYDIEAPWVDVQPRGKTKSGKPNGVIAQHEAKRLQSLLPGSIVVTNGQPEQPPPGEAPLDEVKSKPGEIGHDGYMLLAADLRELSTYTDPCDWLEAYRGQIETMRTRKALRDLAKANQAMRRRVLHENEDNNDVLDMNEQIKALVEERDAEFRKEAA